VFSSRWKAPRVHRDDGSGGVAISASRPPGVAGVSGSGQMCVLTFQAKAAGDSIVSVTKAAARWIRPFVPPIIASAIDTTTRPLRGGRQVFEETEEIHFSLKRTHRVSVQSEEHGSVATEPVEPHAAPASVVSSVERHQMLTEREGHPELRGADVPRQLPPAG